MGVVLDNIEVNYKEVVPYTFSKRESDVLIELTKGNVVKQVADKLCIAYTTADTHIKNAKKRSGAKNMAQLIMLFIKANRELFFTISFLLIQSFTIINATQIDQRRVRKSVRKSNVRRPQKVLNKAA